MTDRKKRTTRRKLSSFFFCPLLSVSPTPTSTDSALHQRNRATPSATVSRPTSQRLHPDENRFRCYRGMTDRKKRTTRRKLSSFFLPSSFCQSHPCINRLVTSPKKPRNALRNCESTIKKRTQPFLQAHSCCLSHFANDRIVTSYRAMLAHRRPAISVCSTSLRA